MVPPLSAFPYRARQLQQLNRFAANSTPLHKCSRLVPGAWCLVPQVRVRLLDANLGWRRSGQAHRTFSTHDLWPVAPPKPVLLGWLKSSSHARFACARPRSRAPVTGFTDNGAPICTLVARGCVSLRPDEGRTAAG